MAQSIKLTSGVFLFLMTFLLYYAFKLSVIQLYILRCIGLLGELWGYTHPWCCIPARLPCLAFIILGVTLSLPSLTVLHPFIQPLKSRILRWFGYQSCCGSLLLNIGQLLNKRRSMILRQFCGFTYPNMLCFQWR